MAGTDVLTGSGVNNDFLAWLQSLGNYDANLRGQDLSYQTNTRGQDLDFASNTRGQDLDYLNNLMNFYMRQYEADLAYDSDVRRYGLDVAQFNYQQRHDAAQLELQQKALGIDQANAQLGVDQFNYQQRSGLADRKLGIIDMLSKRQGPSDWVGYNSVLNMLAPPEPSGSAQIDPFQILEGLVREAKLEIPSWAQGAPSNPKSIIQEYSGGVGQKPQAPTAPSWSMGATNPWGNKTPNPYGLGKGGYGLGASSLLGPAAAAGDGNGMSFSGIRNEDVAKVPVGGYYLGTTGSAGPSRVGDYVGWDVFDKDNKPLTDPGYEIGASTPIWLRRRTKAAAGAVVPATEAVVTGDSPSGKPTGNEELAAVVNPGPDTQLVIQPLNEAGLKAQKKKGSKRAASGGVFNPAANTDPFYIFNRYAPVDLGSQPFIQKLFGRSASKEWTGHYGQLTNPSIGITNAPSLLNLQTYRDLAPSEKDATSNLYDAGLAVDSRDILERSRRAAPFGARFGAPSWG